MKLIWRVFLLPQYKRKIASPVTSKLLLKEVTQNNITKFSTSQNPTVILLLLFFWREAFAFKDKFLEQVYFIEEVPFALFGKFLWERVKVYKKCSISLLIRKPRPFPIYCSWTCCIYSVSVRGLKTDMCNSTSRPFWCEVFFNSSALFASWGIAVCSEGNDHSSEIGIHSGNYCLLIRKMFLCLSIFFLPRDANNGLRVDWWI